MASECTLYAFTFRSRAERVLWTLRELNLSFDLIRLDAKKGEHISDDYLKIHPAGKVPALIHDGKVLTESLAIMEYLNGISETRHLVPTSNDANYQFRRALSFGMSEFEPYLWIADQSSRLGKFFNWPEGSTEESVAMAKKAVKPIQKWLATSDYIAGDEFSLADIYFYQLIDWSSHYGIEFDASTKDYMIALGQRDAFPEEMKGHF